MKVKMNLKSKMLIYILSASILVYVLALGYVSIKSYTIAMNNAEELTQAYAKEFANSTSTEISSEMNIAKSFAQIAKGYNKLSKNEMKDIYTGMLKNLLEENPNILASWINLELKAIWPNWKKSHGRMRLTYYRSGGQILYLDEILDTAIGFNRGTYYDILDKKVEYVMNPYYYTYTNGGEEVYETSVTMPIISNGVSVGAAGFDVELERFQKLISVTHPIKESYAFLIASNGQYVAHFNKDYVGSFIQDSLDDESNILEKIKAGENIFEKREMNGRDYLICYAPVKIGGSPMLWSLGFAAPIDVIMKEEKSTLIGSIYVGLIGLIVIALVIWIIAHSISRPILKTTEVLEDLAKGDIDQSKKLAIKTNDEIAQMNNSVNTLIDGLNKTAVFAKEIGKGNLDKEFDLLSDKDVLGDALIEMRKSLKLAKDQEEKRKSDDQKQNWATQGLAKFGEILRQNNDDMKEFAYHIISNLVKYVNANQGGIFIVNDDEKSDVFIELLACYAYERRKYMEKRIEIGVGLIGRCVQEQKIIQMTDLPKEYMTITSGLGKAVPDSLLIIPLKINDEIFGVVELAGFNKFEPHVVKFVEEVGESIASTISTTKINIRTTQLLAQSQMQSEEMAAQEEEMRQNMEELQATQEEAARRSFEMQGLLNALNSANLVMEYDLEGYIISVNDNYLKLVGTTSDQLIGSHHTDNMKLNKTQKSEINKFWVDLKNGMSKKETERVEFNGKEYIFVATYTPILDEDGYPLKVLKIATDITGIGKS